MSSEEFEYLWKKRHEILHRIELSILYHRERERFLSGISKVTTAIAIIGGSAAYVAVAGPDWLRWSGLVVAVSSTISLVFGIPDRARLHGELAMRYSMLMSDIAKKGERDFTEEDLKTWEAETFKIEADEPPTLPALVRLCQNRLKQAAGHPDQIVHVPWWRRIFAHVI